MQSHIKEIRNLIQRMRIKSIHRKFIEDEIGDWEYKDKIRFAVNGIRWKLGIDSLSKEKFDEAWQYRTMAHENWEIAKDHIINTVMGWW